MTVKELKQKLSKFDEKTPVVLYREADSDMELFEIADIAVSAGTPRRDDNGKAGFTFENNGPVKWLFISVEAA